MDNKQVVQRSLYSKYKDFIVITLIVIIGILLYNKFLDNSYIKEITEQSNVDHHKFETWKDSLGREHAKIKEVPIYLSQASPEAKEKVTNKAKELDIKESDINKIIEAISDTRGQFESPIINDSFEFKDNYISLWGRLNRDSIGSIISTSGDYRYTDTVNWVSYNHKKKILGITYRTDEYLDISFNNPNTSITGVTHISLKDYNKPKRFGIGPSLGVTYDGKIKPYIGFGISYNLVVF